MPTATVNEMIKLVASFLFGSGCVAFIFKGAIKEWFLRCNINWNERKKLAKQVHEIISEGDSCTYKKSPTDSRHIFFIVNQLKAFHPTAAATLRSYLGYWSLLALFNKATPGMPSYQKDNTQYVIELQRQAKKDSDYLLNETVKMMK